MCTKNTKTHDVSQENCWAFLDISFISWWSMDPISEEKDRLVPPQFPWFYCRWHRAQGHKNSTSPKDVSFGKIILGGIVMRCVYLTRLAFKFTFISKWFISTSQVEFTIARNGKGPICWWMFHSFFWTAHHVVVFKEPPTATKFFFTGNIRKARIPPGQRWNGEQPAQKFQPRRSLVFFGQ